MSQCAVGKSNVHSVFLLHCYCRASDAFQIYDAHIGRQTHFSLFVADLLLSSASLDMCVCVCVGGVNI